MERKLPLCSTVLGYIPPARTWCDKAAFNTRQCTDMAAKAKMKVLLGSEGARKGRRAGESRSGRQKGGQHWEKAGEIRAGARSTRESRGNDS